MDFIIFFSNFYVYFKKYIEFKGLFQIYGVNRFKFFMSECKMGYFVYYSKELLGYLYDRFNIYKYFV